MSDTRPSDREGKTIKNSDVEEEEEKEKDVEEEEEGKEKEKDVSEEQNPSSSVVAADAEVSDKMFLQPSAEVILESPSKKQKHGHFTEGHHQSHGDVMSDSDARTGANKEVDPSSTEATKTESTLAEFGQADLLFVARLYPINLETSTLIISRETAEKHFLAGTGKSKVVNLLFSHRYLYDNDREMKLAIPATSTSPMVILVIVGWKEFLDAHNLGAGDLIRFYKPEKSRQDKHYLVDYVKAPRPSGTVESKTGASSIAESNPGTYLFLKQLTSTDTKKQLGISRKDAEENFPTPTIAYTENEVLQLYDAQNVNWKMNLKLTSTTGRAYALFGPWITFVSRHNLKAGDLIMFYRPDQALVHNHFSVRCVNAETYRDDGARVLGTRLFGKDIIQIDCEIHTETVEDDTERSIGDD